MSDHTKQDTAEDLRKALVDVLTAPQLDFAKVVEISARLSRLDPDYVRFESDSGLIDRLGQELVARQETAVSELVKNAYDADGRAMRVAFVEADRPGGRLVLEDDGHGMTREQLIDGFMRLASPQKQAFPLSPRFRRSRAGRKGIGRFSAQRLGAGLELVTQTAEATHAWRLQIDWGKFASGVDLNQIATRVEAVPKQRAHGTTLNISGLRDRWSNAQIARVFRYVEELTDPFPSMQPVLDDATDAKESGADPGFKVTFLRQSGDDEVVIASEDRMVLKHAVATVHAEVDGEGKAWVRVVSGKLGLFEELESLRIDDTKSQTTFKHLRNVKLDAHYFIYDSELMPPQVSGRLRRLGTDQGGIRLYRNGFRVLPYGERRNDWLGLDEESRRRAILPAVANVNWLGAISVVDPEHSTFFEVSSREGLAMNDAMSELIEFGHAAAVKCAVRVASLRGRKLKAGGASLKPPPPPPPAVTAQTLREAAAALEKAFGGSPTSPSDSPGSGETSQAPPRIAPAASEGSLAMSSHQAAIQLKGAAAEIEDKDREIDMLRVLSSLGLSVATFTHEARNRVMSMRDQLELLISDKSLSPVTAQRLGDLRSATQDLKAYLGYFETSLSDVQRRELEEQDVSFLLYEFARAFGPIASKWNIEIDTDVDEGLVSKPMIGSEWSSILTNLFTNSVKAIKRAGETLGRIVIRARRMEEWIEVDFMDNGDGIAPEHWDRIFDPFFTLSAATHDEDLAGMGLGLKIVRDTVLGRAGKVYVTDPPEGFSACIRVRMPADLRHHDFK